MCLNPRPRLLTRRPRARTRVTIWELVLAFVQAKRRLGKGVQPKRMNPRPRISGPARDQGHESSKTKTKSDHFWSSSWSYYRVCSPIGPHTKPPQPDWQESWVGLNNKEVCQRYELPFNLTYFKGDEQEMGTTAKHQTKSTQVAIKVKRAVSLAS